MLPSPSRVSSDEVSTSDAHGGDPVVGVQPGGEALDLAGAAAADQVQQVDFAQDRSERAAEQAVVHRAVRHRETQRPVEAGGNRVRRRARAVQVGVHVQIAADEGGLAQGGEQRLQCKRGAFAAAAPPADVPAWHPP